MATITNNTINNSNNSNNNNNATNNNGNKPEQPQETMQSLCVSIFGLLLKHAMTTVCFLIPINLFKTLVISSRFIRSLLLSFI